MNEEALKRLEQKVRRITRPEPGLLWYYLISALGAACAAPIVVIPLLFRYYTLWYRFDASGVSMGYGVLFRRELQLTYARMQDIHLSQNILERWLGLGSVTVQTAGAQGNLTIVGVKDFEAIRDYLYARMRGVRPDVDEAPSSDDNAVLLQIRDALVRAAEALEDRSAR